MIKKYKVDLMGSMSFFARNKDFKNAFYLGTEEEFAKQYNKKIDTAFKKAVSDYNKDIDRKIKQTEGDIKFAKRGDRPGMFSDLLGIKTMPGKEFITHQTQKL